MSFTAIGVINLAQHHVDVAHLATPPPSFPANAAGPSTIGTCVNLTRATFDPCSVVFESNKVILSEAYHLLPNMSDPASVEGAFWSSNGSSIASTKGRMLWSRSAWLVDLLDTNTGSKSYTPGANLSFRCYLESDRITNDVLIFTILATAIFLFSSLVFCCTIIWSNVGRERCARRPSN
jgi:hypothetical protein